MPWYKPLTWIARKPASASSLPALSGVVRLSPHFTTDEFRCKDGCGGAYVASQLIAALETLRAKVGAPIHVTSGFRCAAHNRAVGGSPSSQHLVGRAVDIRVDGMSGELLYRLANTIPALHGFGVAAGWIHVDVRAGDLVARWQYDGHGRVVAWPETENA